MKVGFIGTGVMGQSIVKHLMRQGYDLAIYTRTKSKAESLMEAGATWQASPKEVAQVSDIIFTMVGNPNDIEEIYFNHENGLFVAEITDKIFVDLTTSTPSLAIKIAEEANKRQAKSLDAPVSGGDLGAQKGTLTIMVGGEEAVYEKVLPLFQTFGQSFTLHGSAGKGQHTKMANQIMVASTMLGLTETLVYAQKAGLDLEKVLTTLSGGSAANWSLENYGPRILKEDYSAGFFVKHFVKDLKIALEEARKLELALPMTDLALKLYERLSDEGFSEDGIQALIKLWWPGNEK